jgi:hypothetical protein
MKNIQYLIVMGLTLLVSWAILIIIKKRNNKKYSSLSYRQSDMHEILKYFFSLNVKKKEKPLSQFKKRAEEGMLKVIVVDNKAYWVLDNVFYVADAFENQVQPETAKPVNVENMSKLDMEKMLFILDSLNDGEVKNDSSSSGNEGF